MGASRRSYSKLRTKNEDKTSYDTPIGEEPKRYVFTKKTPSRIRVRKGPGTSFEHNGDYVDKVKTVEIVEINGDWGLLKRYADTRDGWICLRYLEGPSSAD